MFCVLSLYYSFGELVYKEQPDVITFNYDCFLEKSIESASQGHGYLPASFVSRPSEENESVADDLIPYSSYNWNCALGYGFKFDEVQLQNPGLSKHVGRERFYNHPQNTLYPWKILKLHGSLNWSYYLPNNIYSQASDNTRSLPKEKQNKIMLRNDGLHLGVPLIDTRNGWFINPLIIPMVLYKEQMYNGNLFIKLWRQAKDVLTQCSRLIIIGYSFPPTDFAVKKLFLEAFSNNNLEDLIIVNPDTSVVKTAKELVRFSKPVLVYSDPEEFLKR